MNIFDAFKTKVSDYLLDQKIKWALYGAHDQTLLAILGTLDLNDETIKTIPFYASVINFELSKWDSDYYVNIYFNGKKLSPSCLSLVSADLKKYGCPIDQFNNMYSSISFSSWQDNCQNYDPDLEESCNPFGNAAKLAQQKKISFLPLWIVFSLLGITVCFSMFYFFALRWMRSNKNRNTINIDLELENSDEDDL